MRYIVVVVVDMLIELKECREKKGSKNVRVSCYKKLKRKLENEGKIK